MDTKSLFDFLSQFRELKPNCFLSMYPNTTSSSIASFCLSSLWLYLYLPFLF